MFNPPLALVNFKYLDSQSNYSNTVCRKAVATEFNPRSSLEMIAFAHVITAIVWLLADSVHGHCVITYPGWRGNNLITNVSFPYGMQRSYPCKSAALMYMKTNTC